MKLYLLSHGAETRQGQTLLQSSSLSFSTDKKILCILLPEFEQANSQIIKFFQDALHYPSNHILLYSDLNSVTSEEIQYIYVTSGNPFDIWDFLLKGNFPLFQNLVHKPDITYIGASAGAILAGSNMEHALARARNFTSIRDYTTLGLLPYPVLPHVTDKSEIPDNYLCVGENEMVILDTNHAPDFVIRTMFYKEPK